MCEVSNQAFLSCQTGLFTGSGDAMVWSVPHPMSCFLQYELTQETIRENALNQINVLLLGRSRRIPSSISESVQDWTHILNVTTKCRDPLRSSEFTKLWNFHDDDKEEYCLAECNAVWSGKKMYSTMWRRVLPPCISFYPEDGGITFIRNIGNCLWVQTASDIVRLCAVPS